MTAAQRRRRARVKQAVELRAQGWPLRAIAAHLGASHETVRRDLASHLAVTNVTPTVTKLTVKRDSNVIQLRRKADGEVA